MTNDKQRERLVELLQIGDETKRNPLRWCDDEIVESLADCLLANGVIVPPCKVGDNAYFVHDTCFADATEGMVISEGIVVSVSLQCDGLWIYCRYHSGLTYWHKAEDFGKTVFLTRKEAERALERREECKPKK